MKKFLRSPGPRVPRRATDTSLELDPESLPKASAVRKAKLHKAREAAEETPSPRRRPRAAPGCTARQRAGHPRPAQPPAQSTPAESSPESRPENEISRALARRSQPVGTPTSKQLTTPRPSREQRQAAQHDSAKNSGDIAVPKESATVTRQRRARLRPVPGLDGLRGLAVLAVVIYHFFGDLLPGGYLGVDMFFVLSGFLITSLLVREFAVTRRISLTDFWIRRFRRILPAALVVLCLCTALVAMIGGDLAVGIREQFLGTFFFVNNWTQIATSQTYFAPNEVQVFAHYWSLAVEEQFYLLWPLLMFGAFALSRRQPKRLPIALSLVLAAASAAAMALLFTPGEDPTRVYYGTDTHAFGLLIGALLSLLLTSTSKEAKADSWASTSTGVAAGAVGALALVGYLAQLVWMGADLEFTYRGGLVLTSLLGAAMIWGVVQETGPLTWLFRIRVMRWLGQRSFSLYLWHWPVVMILRELSDAPAWLLGLLALFLSCLLAEVTYQFVETPFRRAGYVATWRTYWASRPTVAEMKDGFGKTMWPAVPAMVILSALGVAYGLITSQDQTELERELERMSQANEQAAASAPATPTETKKPPEKRALPAGTAINAVGDSVMLAASEALNERFPGILIDAEVSRQYAEAIAEIRQLKESGQLRSTVFVGLGTNGPAADGEMDELLTILGSDRTVILVVPFGERDWMGQARAKIIEAAKEHDNVYVADWCGMAQENPALLYDDGVHPQAEGAALYVQALSDALEQYSRGEKSTTTGCSL
ncbi:acyltransferase family protein [uncultured Corynebacterium sp.]|uniref:acyltransferase family protein n=1 Tax=uncultured Corynebacterium sp. TaxID=159447 RepID=UPI002805ACCB|nr:acyltransferase family protein [uncultured Corynebacterium sp.]